MKTLEFLTREKKEESLFGVFETVKVSNGKPLRLELHYERMRKSCIQLNIGLLPDFGCFKTIVENFSSKDCNFLKITATAKGVFLEKGVRTPPEEPVKLLLVYKPKVNSKNPLLLHKTTDYSFFRKITEKAGKEGCFDGIILNEKGNVTQCGKFNIYFEKKGGEIITPPLSEGVLPGIMRTELLNKRFAKEEKVRLKDLPNFTKTYVSNALIELKEAIIVNYKSSLISAPKR